MTVKFDFNKHTTVLVRGKITDSFVADGNLEMYCDGDVIYSHPDDMENQFSTIENMRAIVEAFDNWENKYNSLEK